MRKYAPVLARIGCTDHDAFVEAKGQLDMFP